MLETFLDLFEYATLYVCFDMLARTFLYVWNFYLFRLCKVFFIVFLSLINLVRNGKNIAFLVL